MSAFVSGESSSPLQEFPTSPVSSSPPRPKTNTITTTTIAANNNSSTNSSFATVSSIASALDCLQFILPAMEMKVLLKALEESLEELSDFESAIMSLIPSCLDSSTEMDDQNWHFEEEPKKRSKQVSNIASSGYGNGSTWPPRTSYLLEADIYALPYTVPF